jgi:decaprenyl-phosphate phosphoribosyltransferase
MFPGLVRTMRPHQWVKNLFVLAPLVFARELTNVTIAGYAFAGFACFCVLSSAVYVLNDLVDVEADREHPTKKNRAIASGKLSIEVARSFFVGLLVLAIAGSALLGMPFLLVAMGYLTNNLAYSFGLKKIAYLDVLSIAAGFELRVLAGAFAASVPPSSYLLLETFLLACFLGLGKRRHELAHVSAAGETRAALRAYDPRIVTGLLGVTGIASFAVYTIYTLDPHTIAMFGTEYLAVTSVFMLVGVTRFVQLTQKTDADSPTDAMLKDKLFMATFVLGAITVVALIYAG